MSLKKRTLLSLCLFALLFVGLLVTATFTDLQVSNILTRGVLPAGEYYADDVFGVGLECAGTAPELLISALAAELLWLWLYRFYKPGALRTLLLCLGGAAVTGLYAWEYHDLSEYILRHVAPGSDIPGFLWLVIGLAAAFTAVLGTLAVNNFSDENIKKLARFALVTLGGIVCALLLVQAIKNPVGRMRYRAMNVINDQSGFTRWYVLNGQPDKEWMRSVFGTSDAYKSFPSGHTRAAAATFYLIPLADVAGVKSRVKRGLIWCFCILFTGAVALSRIMVGAHFFSDVLVGGTIGFAVCMAAREIFICRFAHLKALKQ